MADNNSRTLTANFVADTSGFSPKINDLIQRLKTLNQDFEQNKAKVKELNSQIKVYQQELNRLNASTSNGASASVEQRQRMQQLRDSIAACNTQIGTYRAAQTNLRSQINSTNRELVEQQQAFNGVNTSAMSFGEILKANLASSAIQAGLRKILDSLRQAAAYCYQVGSSFEAAMSQVAAISGATADELDRLTAKARELGSTTKFTATEAAQAMNYMAMAGWKTEEMLDGIDGILGLAAASGTDLATTSDIVTDALTAFGLKASDCAHFADVLAAASSNANTNVSMMGETFKYCAPVAGALGFSAEDVAVGVGLMANSGIKATNAGTAMRTVMTNLAKDVKITGEAIGEVTVRTSNADGSMRKFSDILTDLRAVFSQLTESERAVVADSIAGKNAMSGFLALMNAGDADVQKLTNAIRDCDGAASSMAETMQDNVQGAVTKFNSALEGVGIAVYDKFKDGLTDVVNIFTECMSDLEGSVENGSVGSSIEELADSFRSAANEIALVVKDSLPGFIKGLTNTLNFVVKFRKEIAAAVAGFVAFKGAMKITNTVKAAVGAISTFITAIKAADGAATKFKVTMSTMPWGLVAAGVGLVVGALVDVSMHADDSAEKLERLRQESDEAAQSAEEYAEKTRKMRDVSRRYEEIQKSSKTAYDKVQDLKALQDELIQQYPDLKGQIDLVTGAYKDQAAAIQSVIDKNNENMKKDAGEAYNKMNAKEEVEKGVSDYLGYSHNKNVQIPFVDRPVYKERSQTLQDKRIQEIFKELAEDYEGISYRERKDTNISNSPNDEDYDVSIVGDSKEKYEAYKALTDAFVEQGLVTEGGDISDLYNHLNDKLHEYEEKVKENEATLETYNKYFKGKKVYDVSGGWGMASEWIKNNYADDVGYEDEEERPDPLAGLSQEEREERYKQDKQLADDMYSVGELSAEDYYKKLVELRDKYLDEGTHEWYQATAQIQSAYAKTADGIADTTKNTANKVKNSLDEVQMAYKKTIAAIDAEIERHNREKSDLEFQAKIKEIDDQIAYGRLDDFSKYELEKERQRLVNEHDEELYERSAADAKAIVQDVYSAKTTLDKADIGTREYTLAVGDYTDALGDLTEVMRGVGAALGVQNGGNSSVSNIDESTKNNYVNVILQAVNKSNSQIIDELLKALHSGL